MKLLPGIVAFAVVLAPHAGNAQYRPPDYPVYAPPPYAPADAGPMTVHDDSERYLEDMERRHEHHKKQLEDWHEYRKKQIENWREYRKQEIEAWRENRERRREHREHQFGDDEQ
jgi:hypothetical protein